MQITYRTDVIPTTAQIIELYEGSGLPRLKRIARLEEISINCHAL